jgi:catalase
MKFLLLLLCSLLVLTTAQAQKKNKKKQEKQPAQELAVHPPTVKMFDELAASYASFVPDRFVHARGAGAYGEFVCSSDWSDYTQASIFSKRGQKNPIFVRFSTVVGGSNSPEVVRDLRGMAIKFYTPEGNYDLLGHHLLVFLLREPIKFNRLIEQVKSGDPNKIFGFMAENPETLHMLSRLYSHLGTPKSFRHLDACSVNAYKWRNKAGKMYYVKYTWRSKEGFQSLSSSEMKDLLAANPYAHSNDLQEKIAQGQFPSWDLYVQILRPGDLDKLAYNPLDATKLWGEEAAPYRLLGTFTLNRNPEDVAREVEASAFAPANLIPGIEPSEDRLLQARMFSYPVASRNRLGDEYMKIGVNQTQNPAQAQANYSVEILADSTLVQLQQKKTEDFLQPGEFFRSLSPSQQAELMDNLSADLRAVKDPAVVLQIVRHCQLADPRYGQGLAERLGIEL